MVVRLALIGVLASCGGGGDDAADAAAGADAPGGSAWSSAPPTDGAIQETAAVAVDGRIYVIGGFDASVQVVSTVRVFDTATETWSTAPDLPEPVHHANAAVVDGTIYVVGALQGLAFTAIGDVWSWNPATDVNSWAAHTPMPTGTQRGSSIVGVIDGRIHVAGGLRGGAVADVSAYDPLGDSWDTSLPALPAARDHGCGGVVGGVLYVTGGREGQIESTSGAVYAYTPGGAWEQRAPMPTGRGGTACGVIDDRIIVVGGEGNPEIATGVFPQAEAYDPAADAWASLEPMPTPRHGMAAAAWAGKLYVPGGATEQGFGAVDTHEVLTP